VIREGKLDLVRQVLDHQLVDEKLVPCGKVDDLLLEWSGRGPPRVAAIAVGRRARMRRLPSRLRWLLCPRRATSKRKADPCVPWRLVSKIDENISLSRCAADLGLDAAERRLARWLAKLPLGS